MTRVLEQEQEELLKVLVEAARNVPSDEREQFHQLNDGDGSSILHPGLPDREMRVHDGDIDILQAEGLLLVTRQGRGQRSFVVTPQGSRFYEELQHSSGAPTQQVEETLTRYLDSNALSAVVPGGAPQVGRGRRAAMEERLPAAADDDWPSVPGSDAGFRDRAGRSPPTTGRGH
jgi:hypothetical protein